MRTHTRQDGFALVAVLIVVSLMLTMGLTWLQHSGLDSTSAMSGRDMSEATEVIDSSLSIVREDLAAGGAAGSRTLTLDGRTTHVTVADLTTAGHRRWDVDSKNSVSIGTTLMAESESVAAPKTGAVAHPDRLPSLTTSLVTALGLGSVPKTTYTGATVLDGVELTGLHVLESGATLTVRDVVLDGSILSQKALDGQAPGDHDDGTAPTLIIDGSLRITPGSDLEGVAILIPDGVVTTSVGLEDRYQLLGAVVAHTVEFASKGTVSGALAYVESVLSDELARPGYGREPLELPEGLDPGAAWQDGFLAFVPLGQGAADLQSISGFFDVADK